MIPMWFIGIGTRSYNFFNLLYTVLDFFISIQINFEDASV